MFWLVFDVKQNKEKKVSYNMLLWSVIKNVLFLKNFVNKLLDSLTGNGPVASVFSNYNKVRWQHFQILIGSFLY